MTIGQDENSCIVYGMPAMAAQKGYVDTILPLDEIGKTISAAMVDQPNSKAPQK
jgi:two-component system chemotaxis response regulator CheB